MELVVCVKQVADPEAVVEVTADGDLKVEDRWITSFFDEVAVEQALQLRQQIGGRVTAVTAGVGKAVDALRRAIAMGADRAIMVDDAALTDADGVGIARALAAVLTAEPVDLVLCGKASLDQEAGVVGPALAELLGLPHLAGAVRLEVVDGAVVAGCAVEGGTVVRRCPLPALVTVGKGIVEPRVPPVTGVMKAMRAPIDRRSLQDLAVELPTGGWQPARYHAPPRRPPVQMIEGEFPANVDALVGALQDRGVLS
jgi:electron transfer flavoprotein beta subunit